MNLLDGSKHNGERLDDLLEDYSTGLLPMTQCTAARGTAQSKLNDLNRQIDSASIRSAVGGLPAGDLARAAWDNSDPARKRNLLGLLIDRVTINPSNVSSLKASQLYKGRWRC